MALKLWSLDWPLSASPGHWLETQILRPHSRLAESDPWSEPGSPHLTSLLGGVDTAWEPRVKDISEYWHKSSNQKAANEQNLSFGKEDSGRGQDRIWTRRSLDQIQTGSSRHSWLAGNDTSLLWHEFYTPIKKPGEKKAEYKNMFIHTCHRNIMTMAIMHMQLILKVT